MSPSSDIRFPKHSCPSCPGKPRSALWPRLVPGGRWFPAPSRAAVGHCLSSAEKLDRSSVRSLRLLVTERVTGVGDSAVSAAQGPRAPCRTVRRGARLSPAPRAPCRAVHRGARPSPAPRHPCHLGTRVGESAVSATQSPRASCRTVHKGARPSPAVEDL